MQKIMREAQTIAVVGLSSQRSRAGYYVPGLPPGASGYRIIPVNPNLRESLGEKAYPDLAAVPEPIDLVLIFQRSEKVPTFRRAGDRGRSESGLAAVRHCPCRGGGPGTGGRTGCRAGCLHAGRAPALAGNGLMATEERQARWEVQLGFLTFGRLLLNIMLRLGYPFLPELARGLAVSQADIASVIALGNLSGLASPLFGPLSERFGRRLMIVISYLVLGLGALLLLIWPRFWALSIFLILLALMKVIHDPALQAYVGERVPYNRRGRAIAIIEIAWGGALLFGAPLVGWLIQWQNWAAPYILFSLLGMLVGLLLYRLMPRALPVAGRLIAKRG